MLGVSNTGLAILSQLSVENLFVLSEDCGKTREDYRHSGRAELHPHSRVKELGAEGLI